MPAKTNALCHRLLQLLHASSADNTGSLLKHSALLLQRLYADRSDTQSKCWRSGEQTQRRGTNSYSVVVVPGYGQGLLGTWTEGCCPLPHIQVEHLITELSAGGSQALGIQLDEGVLPRLCAYARSVAHYPTAIKEVTIPASARRRNCCCLCRAHLAAFPHMGLCKDNQIDVRYFHCPDVLTCSAAALAQWVVLQPDETGRAGRQSGSIPIPY